jgi:hypothetical protein
VPAQSEAAVFATTHWSVVLAAQSPSPAADEALEKLAALIGGRFTDSCDGMAMIRKKHRI